MEDTALRQTADAIEEAGAVADAGALAETLAPHLGRTPDAEEFGNSDAVFLMVDRLFPGWSITVDGVASEKHGHWVVVLRRSASRDNDPFVGIGRARRLPAAILAALLKALALSD